MHDSVDQATRLPLYQHADDPAAQVIPQLSGDATEQTPPDLPSYLFKERIVYLVGAPILLVPCCLLLLDIATSDAIMLGQHVWAELHLSQLLLGLQLSNMFEVPINTASTLLRRLPAVKWQGQPGRRLFAMKIKAPAEAFGSFVRGIPTSKETANHWTFCMAP